MFKPPPFKFASTTALMSGQVAVAPLGTCLSTAELRKAMARFIDAQGASDLDVHHEAVRLTSDDARVAKPLDKRHDAAVQRFARSRAPHEIAALWDGALRLGEIPGAYWALLTHRHATADLRQRAFGEVHMLSHLVGAASRADIRRLVALEKENAELHDRLDRQHARSQQLLDERDAAQAQLQRAALDDVARQAHAQASQPVAAETEHLVEAVALQTSRRERAEVDAESALRDNQRLHAELERLRDHARALGHELAAAERHCRR